MARTEITAVVLVSKNLTSDVTPYAGDVNERKSKVFSLEVKMYGFAGVRKLLKKYIGNENIELLIDGDYVWCEPVKVGDLMVSVHARRRKVFHETDIDTLPSTDSLQFN